MRAKLRHEYSSHLLARRSKASLEYAVPGKSLAVEGGLRLHELERGTEVTLSRQLEVIGRLEGVGCWGTLWSEERHGASSLTATSRRGFPFSGHRLQDQHTPFPLRFCGMPNLKYSPGTAVCTVVQ